MFWARSWAMRSPVMCSPFWILKAFPRAVMMLAGFCCAEDSDAFVAIACCDVVSSSNVKRGLSDNIRGNKLPCLLLSPMTTWICLGLSHPPQSSRTAQTSSDLTRGTSGRSFAPLWSLPWYSSLMETEFIRLSHLRSVDGRGFPQVDNSTRSVQSTVIKRT